MSEPQITLRLDSPRRQFMAGEELSGSYRLDADAETEIKAVELSGQPNLLFRRNSLDGRVEVLSRSGEGVVLNTALHA